MDELVGIEGQSSYGKSKYLAKVLNCLNNIIMGWLKELIYMKMWLTETKKQ